MTKFTKHSSLLHRSKNIPNKSKPIVEPISHAAAYSYDDEYALSNIYQNKDKGFTYARTGSPTTSQVEAKINLLEQGIGCVGFTTGMAAYDNMFFTLFNHKTHIIASKFLFANTISLLKSYSNKFGIEVTYVDVTNINEVKQAKKINTQIILVETIANPCTQIPALFEIGEFAKENNLVYIVDNTITSPASFIPKLVGASLVVHSLTKSISGHSRSLGGAVIDTGLFDWSKFSNIEEIYRPFKEQAYIMQLRKKGLRDKGATLTAMQADLIAIGLETLYMRVEKANNNADMIAQYLDAHTNIENVMHPSLANHKQHKQAKKYFNGNGYLISFEVKNIYPFDFIKKLELIISCSSIGDNRSLIIHPNSTIFAEISTEQKLEMGITDNTFRLSVGIEDVQDLINDLDQALKI